MACLSYAISWRRAVVSFLTWARNETASAEDAPFRTGEVHRSIRLSKPSCSDSSVGV
jgi:hypothetical protein